jgi:hypothetical protein
MRCRGSFVVFCFGFSTVWIAKLSPGSITSCPFSALSASSAVILSSKEAVAGQVPHRILPVQIL